MATAELQTDLVQALIAAQKLRGWTGQQMAMALGISKPYWSLLASTPRQRNPGIAVIRSALREFADDGDVVRAANALINDWLERPQLSA